MMHEITRKTRIVGAEFDFDMTLTQLFLRVEAESFAANMSPCGMLPH